MTQIVCPFCGKDYGAHGGQACPVLDSSLSRAVRAAVAAIENDRTEKAKLAALNTSVTPLVYRLDNAAGNAQRILQFNSVRGAALIYNDDAADVWLGDDKQHIEDATKRYPLKTKNVMIHNSPAELWAFGNAAGPQLVSVIELPRGVDAAYAFLAKLA
jgi:hypothetical protein